MHGLHPQPRSAPDALVVQERVLVGHHIFNTVLTYKGEPQSYTGRPPGLSTRLFLRLGPEPIDTYCHLIYPAGTTAGLEAKDLGEEVQVLDANSYQFSAAVTEYAPAASGRSRLRKMVTTVVTGTHAPRSRPRGDVRASGSWT